MVTCWHTDDTHRSGLSSRLTTFRETRVSTYTHVVDSSDPMEPLLNEQGVTKIKLCSEIHHGDEERETCSIEGNC